MFNFFAKENQDSPNVWNNINNLVLQIEPQLTKLSFGSLNLIKLRIKISNDSDLAHLLTILDIIFV